MDSTNEKGSGGQSNPMLLYRWAQELWNQGREETINDIVDPDAVFRFPIGNVIGQSGFRKHYNDIRSAFSSLSMTLLDTVIQGDLVAARWDIQMRHTGDFRGIPATERHVFMSGMTFGKVRNGRFYECWDEWNLINLLAQLNALPDNLRTAIGLPPE